MAAGENKLQIYVNGGFYYSNRYVTVDGDNKPLYDVNIPLLGVVGETFRGPAFKPIFITEYIDGNQNKFTAKDVFNSVFGDTNDYETYNATGNLRYELAVVANRYLEASKQIFVTRVLGLSGYDAGKAWAITLRSNIDTDTLMEGPLINQNMLFTLVFDSNSQLTSFTSNNTNVQSLINNGVFDDADNFNFYRNLTNATLYNLTNKFNSNLILTNENVIVKTGVTLTNVSMINRSYDLLTGTTAVFSGEVRNISVNVYGDVEDVVVAVLRSRGKYVDSLLNFEVSGGSSNIGFNSEYKPASSNITKSFLVTGTTNGVLIKDTDFNSGPISLKNIKNALGTSPFDDVNSPIFVSELYDNMLNSLISEGKIRGIKMSLIEYGDKFKNYKQHYQKPETPWIVSQVFGSSIFRLFKCLSLHDGEYGNNQIKITITNIDLTDFTFDLVVRAIDEPDDSGVFVENYIACSMNPVFENFIGRKVGTYDGEYPQKSNYITLEISDDYDVDNSVPAGFLGYPIKDYSDTVSGVAKNPIIKYKTDYTTITNSGFVMSDDKDKVSLGICKYTINGQPINNFDLDMFKHIGATNYSPETYWTGTTNGFHLDSGVNGAKLNNYKVYAGNNQYYTPKLFFNTGPEPFTDEATVSFNSSNNYYLKQHRKFTLVLYGGFDGWDIYREERTFGDRYQTGKDLGDLGYTYGYFNKYSSDNSNYAITSDYYAFLDGIATFRNPEETPINLFATPGIDVFKNTNLVEYTIDLAEDVRQDILYLPTLPDTDIDNGNDANRLLVDDVIDTINNEYDTTYAALYWPWITNVYNNPIFVPPTCEVVRLMAEAGDLFKVVSGIKLGELGIDNERIYVRAIQRGSNTLLDNGIFYKTIKQLPEYLTDEEMNLLYANRINPLNTFMKGEDYGVYLWGNKTLQNIYTERNLIPIEVLKNQAYIPIGRSRISIRRLLLYLKVLVTNRLKKYLFQQNDNINKNNIKIELDSLMKELVGKQAISEYSIQIDDINTNIDSYTLSGKINFKPYNSLEYVEFLFDVPSNE